MAKQFGVVGIFVAEGPTLIHISPRQPQPCSSTPQHHNTKSNVPPPSIPCKPRSLAVGYSHLPSASCRYTKSTIASTPFHANSPSLHPLAHNTGVITTPPITNKQTSCRVDSEETRLPSASWYYCMHHRSPALGSCADFRVA